jgi:hypothetical protein
LGFGAGERLTDVTVNDDGDRAEVLTSEGPESGQRRLTPVMHLRGGRRPFFVVDSGSRTSLSLSGGPWCMRLEDSVAHR